jgi:predicted outer membrane lipoprotein
MRQRTSKARRHRHHVKVLKSEVMSPRIAWFNFLSALRSLTKFVVIMGLLLAAAYGIRAAIEHTFHRNPDFQLKAINLNPNDVLDESDLVELLEINLTANIFDFDVDALEAKLLEQPAISSARVERNLPGTLDFRITTRKPAAWIACAEEGFHALRRPGSLVVDHEGFAYRCPPGQAEVSQELPILVLSKNEDHPIRAGTTLGHPQYTQILRLLKSVVSECPDELSMIDSISQANAWSLNLVTRAGTVATFGLGDHARQLDYLARALDHARRKGYEIGTINLIPKRNVPITVSADAAPPRAIPVDVEALEETPDRNSQSDDLRTLLNRN